MKMQSKIKFNFLLLLINKISVDCKFNITISLIIHKMVVKGEMLMQSKYELSAVSQEYLSRYYELLDTMIHSMTNAKLCESVSHNFIAQMIPHHQAAVDMSENLLKYTTCVPLQNLARKIIRTQTHGIDEMKKVLDCCSDQKNNQRENSLYNRCFEQICNKMFFEMSSVCYDNRINCNYIRQMVPHHCGGIAMAKNALRFCLCKPLKPMLCEMIESQQANLKVFDAISKQIKC